MAFAVNYIGHYILPWDWSHKPEEVTCHSKRDAGNNTHIPHDVVRRNVDNIGFSAVCDASQDMTITIDMGPEPFPKLSWVSMAYLQNSNNI